MEESDSTPTRILDAAGEEFAAKGFEDATVREICQRAGANIAAVNYHFGDKHRLYVETVKRAHKWRLNQAPLPNWVPGTPADVRLSDFIRTFLRRMVIGDSSWHSRLMLREMLRPDSACVEVVREYIRPEFEALISMLRELLGTRLSDPKLHLLAFSIVGQCLHYRVADPIVNKLVDANEYATYTPEFLAEHVIEFTFAALRQFAVPDRVPQRETRA